jgi:signal transduction histidine kinase
MDPVGTRTAFAPSDAPSQGRTFKEPVSWASERLRALATLSGSLTDALDPDDAAKLVEQEAFAALGTTSAVVVTLGPFPPTAKTGPPPADARLHLVHAIGVPEEVQAALRELPLDAPIPFAEVARSGEALFLESRKDLNRYPEWGAAMVRAGAEAAAVVPVWANGELRGVLGLSWPDPHIFDEDERAFVLTLGVMCAQAILRSYLRAAESAAREQAERANRSKANFLTMISHELRTPMNAVIGYSELIRQGLDGPVTARQTDHLERMESSGAHLLDLIEELLGYARLEAGRDAVQPEPVQLLETIESALDLIRPLADKKGLRIRVERPEEPVELFTDTRKLRQILVNVLANAVKFTEDGEVVLIVHVEGKDALVKIIFEVTDSGQGMSLDAQAHLFDAFWQRDPTSALSGGTGLGLPIARQLARLLGGDVKLVKSAEGVGSTFVVSLPVHYVAVPAAD